ncbi:MAG: hypothetical protein ACR2M4_01615 [Actinomycetota bacterium]
MRERPGRQATASPVGTLTRVQLVSGDYQFEYVFDPDIPPIPNSVLFSKAADDLHIDTTGSIPESSRNHWSIKDADLFKVLLKCGFCLRLKPKVFDLSDEPIDEELVAVMMPFEAAFNPVYEALQTAIGEVGMTCRRADDIWENDHVVQDVALLSGRRLRPEWSQSERLLRNGYRAYAWSRGHPDCAVTRGHPVRCGSNQAYPILAER